MNFRKKQKEKTSLANFFIRVGAIFIICILLFLVITDIKIYQKRKKLQTEIAKYEQQIKEIKLRNAELEERVENSDNPDYIEKIAREEQDMQKSGESVVSFIMPEEKQEIEEAKNNMNDWFGQLANWIKSLF
jgi:cell division protein DivIC